MYTSNTISVFINNGDGTFAAKVDYATGSRPYGIFVEDFDGDTIPDVATANRIDRADIVMLVIHWLRIHDHRIRHRRHDY